jgi:hypothetical protein
MDAVEAAHSVLIEVLTILGQYLDKVVIIGGWVPELFFPEQGHMGSTDVDLALDAERIPPIAYGTIRRLLIGAGYRPTDLPNRFVRRVENHDVKVDLITGESSTSAEDSQHRLVQEMMVWKARGVDLALLFNREMEITGTLPGGGQNTVSVRVPLVSAYLCMKSITLSERMKPKDAYDIYFTVVNHPEGPGSLAEHFRSLRGNGLVEEALTKLRAKFRILEEIGPVWAAQVARENGEDEEMARRKAFEYVSALLDQLGVE